MGPERREAPSAAESAGRATVKTMRLETALNDVIGFVAAACTTFAFVPQVVRVWRTRSAKDISLAMYVILVAGVTLWIVYGVSIRSTPLVAANLTSLVLISAVLVGKLRFARGARSAPSSRDPRAAAPSLPPRS